MSDVLIIGYGVVGRNLARELAPLHPDIYDKYKPEYNTRVDDKRYKFAFICVDTPRTETDSCNTNEVWDALLRHEADIYYKINGDSRHNGSVR